MYSNTSSSLPSFYGNDVFETPFAETIFREKYSRDGEETWADTARRVVESVCADRISSKDKNALLDLATQRKFIPGGRYLYSAGRDYHNVNNCFLFRAEDSREGWSELHYKVEMATMSGGGIGSDYSDIREKGSIVHRTGGVASGPVSLARSINEMAREVLNGGNRRAALWGGLSWWHKDIHDWLGAKNHSPELRALKERDFTFPLPLEFTNISVIYDKDFFTAYEDETHTKHAWARDVWAKNCLQAFSTAEPGMSINFKNARESLRNACCEVVSEDDSDKCNLGTLWFPRFSSREELSEATRLATLFLLCGGIYSHVPTEKIREVGSKNNRIGLGIAGLHEWCMLKGFDYEVTPEMHSWLEVYRDESDKWAAENARLLGVNEPKGKRAIAPNGTIGMVAETTTGVEPLFCAAYKRRYFKEGKWMFQYVIDGSVKRLMQRGVSRELIERNDAYALGFEQRVKFQADVQDYVDMSISSTCNMASWGSVLNNEETVQEYSDILYKYAPRLRGFTCYPDGSRGGQPLTKVSLREAGEKEGMVYAEEVRECLNGVCGL